MKILVIGATGTIGGAVADALAARHEVVRASRRGPVRVDMADTASIDALFADLGDDLDAVVCCAASGGLTPLDSPSDDRFWSGLDGKLIGQVNLVRRAIAHVRDGGSVTLTSGRFTEPVPGSSLGYLVNAGLEAFVHAAAPEMPRGLRLNAVSPGWVRETLAALGLDPAPGTPAAEVARAYVDAVEGDAHGRTLTVGPA
ncbi:short chain dehydrogenase [Streptomyces sparsogenes]|uniref:short chain dehydrogenase n=1 Tax=Streptomyces sparsogenes TaxID=67365 RepID=UPI003321B3BD